ncbi:MAG TPA: GNAT family protein [Gaiella sp.]|jgi:RimJ/RimL family protein N-acetyltransferase|nr:GNAT family protein [Gaiella sp.]
MSVTVRRAIPEDVPFLVGLITHEDVAPFLAGVRATTEEEIASDVARSLAEPEDFGVMVFAVEGERAGTATWERVNRRSEIASVGAFAIDPAFRGRGVGDEAARVLQRHLIREVGLHRLQIEIYGFNDRALRHAERAGWVREGIRRKAYRRDDEWVDGVLFGLVAEDL